MISRCHFWNFTTLVDLAALSKPQWSGMVLSVVMFLPQTWPLALHRDGGFSLEDIEVGMGHGLPADL